VTTNNSEEVRVNHINAMGGELGSLYSELWQQLANLHLKWNKYIGLFGVNQDRVKLLNEAAPSFFYIIENTLWLDILLTVARLTDPCEMKKKGGVKRNLTFQRLPDLISDVETKEKVKSLIEAAKDKSSFCREWRNSYIAHRDLDLTLKTTNAKPLEEGLD
jgi:hypothetical protein